VLRETVRFDRAKYIKYFSLENHRHKPSDFWFPSIYTNILLFLVPKHKSIYIIFHVFVFGSSPRDNLQAYFVLNFRLCHLCYGCFFISKNMNLFEFL
jgi:hypothetical protein